MARIISISGLISSGKDSIAKYLINEHGFVKDSFAKSLKDAVAVMFGWDRKMLEGETAEDRAIRETVDPWWAKRLGIPKLTPRWVLQYYGTEVCRKHLHDDIWLATVERRLETATQDIVITDSRFPNELKMLRNHGATLISVQRGELPDWWDVAAKGNNGDPQSLLAMQVQSAVHPSEWSWAGYDFDYELKNDGTLDDLFDKVSNLPVLK